MECIEEFLSPQRADTTRLKQKARPAMERLVSPALCESPEDVAVGYNQHVAIGALFFSLTHHGGMPLLSDVLDQPVKALRDVGGASVRRLDIPLPRTWQYNQWKWKWTLTRPRDSHLSRCPS